MKTLKVIKIADKQFTIETSFNDDYTESTWYGEFKTEKGAQKRLNQMVK